MMVNEVESKKTPLQEKMDELGKQLSAFSIGIILVIIVIGVIQGKNWLEMFNVGGKKLKKKIKKYIFHIIYIKYKK